MRANVPYVTNRRNFLKIVASGIAGVAGLQLFSGCKDDMVHITGSIIGANHKTGHLLRNADHLPAPTQTLEADIVIVGGGIAGLSARRWLTQHSHYKTLLLEMDVKPGGNSQYRQNNISAYPLGAHYLPVPNNTNTELIDFLEECGSITGYNEQGIPVYNEYHLCHDPEDRLFINGYWQEGLVPNTGITDADTAAFQRFFKEVERLKNLTGNDGKYVFEIPITNSSNDDSFTALHNISFHQYLEQDEYKSPALEWYLEYCCKDDYGADLRNTSAWAGLHYFAARRGKGTNATSASILTWPEGNGFLMDRLQQHSGHIILSSSLVYHVSQGQDGVHIKCYNAADGKSTIIHARKLIMATPVRVNKRLLKEEPTWQALATDKFRHAPWVIANLTVTGLPQSKGMPLCWDNVIYGESSVGYVNACHQQLHDSTVKTITWYLPIVSNDDDATRQAIHSKPYTYWRNKVLAELEKAHPGVTRFVQHCDVWIWGHGMIMPSPDFMTCNELKVASTPINNIFFAHTDLCGISIFEEAFYQGIFAAKAVIDSL